MVIKIALPKGRLLKETAALLEKAGWGMDGYREGVRFFRFTSRRFADLSAKLFHEKDIPIQVAIGNYDLGICGLDWVEELLVGYPSSALVKVKDLGYGGSYLYVAASRYVESASLSEMQERMGILRIASEYPNLSESFAAHQRLKRFKIFPLWGGAAGYPPESAELVLISAGGEAELCEWGLAPVARVLDSSAFLVANKDSWETKDLSEVLATIGDKLLGGRKAAAAGVLRASETQAGRPYRELDADVVRLALPDGHQQSHATRLLKEAGIRLDDYPSATGNRRPRIDLDGVVARVIRPQDMPLQVANGNFDLAITGRDWLREHLYQFPSSPVEELLDLKIGKVRIVAVVSQKLAVSGVFGLRQLANSCPAPLRVASEYVNIADKYARDNHLGPYRIIPTWGATEAFLPEDADLLIENTETGSTIARHNLKIVDNLFESTACLIGATGVRPSRGKQARMKSIIEMLGAAVEKLSQKAGLS